VGSGFGGDTRVGIEITSDRDPDDFAIPSATKYKFRASHSFDSGVSLGASLEVTDTAFSPSHRENLEATAGYRYRLTDAFSLVGSAGAGERFRAASDGGNFPYYLATVAGDIRITETMTWNAISYRYRNAFDPAYDYETPQIASGLTLGLSAQSWMTIKLSRSWKGETPSSTGIAIGYQFGF
jgi:hypothetical protein